MKWPRRPGFLLLAAALSYASLSCDDDGAVLDPNADPDAALRAQISLPDGFKIHVYADGLIRPRALALGDSGTVFAGTYFFTPGATSPVYALRDEDGDNRVDVIIEIRNSFNSPNGVDYHAGTLFISDEDRVFRIDDVEANLLNPNPVLLYDGLPSRVETDSATRVGHFWRPLRYGPDDKIYIGVGTRWSFLVGAHTANDLNDDWRYSTIVRMNPDGSGVEVYANGVRNSMGMDFHPETGDLYFTDNGPSWPFDDPRFYDIPPDELNRAPVPGMDFGFPYIHGRLPDPLIGGAAPAGLIPPAHEFEGHTAPLGMRFYTGDMFPEEYHNAIFVAEHGTEATTPTTSRSQVSGDRISVIKLGADGMPASYEVFADGFLTGTNATYTRRPVDLLVLPDGSLLVSDDEEWVIYRIYYEP